jgi:hypothetical protein
MQLALNVINLVEALEESRVVSFCGAGIPAMQDYSALPPFTANRTQVMDGAA